MVAFFSWMLLIFAILDVLFAIVQLFFLSSMKIIVKDMSVALAWSLVVLPSVLVLMLAAFAIINPMLAGLWLVLGYAGLVGVVIFQVPSDLAIRDGLRDRRIQNRERIRSRSGQVSNKR